MRFLTKQVKLFDWDDHQIGRFDLAKGLYVIGMIIRHANSALIINMAQAPGHSKWITALKLIMVSCSEPGNVMLMLMCGYDFRKKSMRSAVRSQVRFLWKPYLITTLAIFVSVAAAAVMTGGDIWAELGRKALPFLCGNVDGRAYFGIKMESIGPLWFILVYIVCGIMLNAVLQINDEALQWLIVLVLYDLGLTSNFGLIGFPDYLPFGIYCSLRYTLYMYIGYQMKKRHFFDKRFPVWMILLLGVYACLCVLKGHSGVILLLILALGMLALILRLKRLQKTRLGKWICWLGRQIMYFCCVHTVVRRICMQEVMLAYFPEKPFVGAMITTAIYAVTGIGGCMLIDHIKRRKIMKKAQKAIGGNQHGQE